MAEEEVAPALVTLPDSVLRGVLLPLLDARSLAFLAATCSSLRSCVDDEELWRRAYVRDFAELSEPPASWRIEYAVRASFMRTLFGRRWQDVESWPWPAAAAGSLCLRRFASLLYASRPPASVLPAAGPWVSGGRPPHDSAQLRRSRESRAETSAALLSGSWRGCFTYVRDAVEGDTLAVSIGLSVSESGAIESGWGHDALGRFSLNGSVSESDSCELPLPLVCLELWRGEPSGGLFDFCPGARMRLTGRLWPFGMIGAWEELIGAWEEAGPASSDYARPLHGTFSLWPAVGGTC